MGTIAKVTAGGSTHLIASTCYGTCATAAATVAKVATIQDNQAFTLMTGVTIHIKFTYSNTAADPTLNVNSTGAKAIKAYGTTKTGASATTSWYEGSIVSFTYDGTNWIQNDYKYNTDADTHQMIQYYANIQAGSSAIVAGNIIVSTNGSKYHHLKDGTAFDIRYPILYAGSAIAANAAGSDNWIVRQVTITTTQSITLNLYQPVYIKGTLNGTTFTPVSTSSLIQTLPSTDDGYHYIFLGCATGSADKIFLTEDHRIYYFKDGSLKEVNLYSNNAGTVNGHTVNSNVPSNAKFTDTTYSLSTGDSNGQIKVTPSSGSAYNVSVKGLGSNAYTSTAYVPRSSELLTTNPFAPSSLRGPYISKIDNAYYSADKRWTVTATNASGSIESLFDGSYESYLIISNGNTSVITIDFSNESGGYFPGYAYGKILVSFYYVCKPASITGRVYCNYEPHGIGWHNLTFSPISDNTNASMVYYARQEYHQISKVEITIVGDTTNSYGKTQLSQIEMHLDRPDSSRNPFLSKYKAETLYYTLTAPNFKGNINGFTIAKSVPADAVFTDTQSDWNQTSSSALDYIKNKPTLGTAAAKNYTTSVTQNSSDLVTSGAVWTAINNLPEPMIFKGTLGTGGTITSLPTAAAANEGFTYKVITAGTYASQAAKVGDVFISNGSSWVLIPAGDTDTDTWRNIKVNGTELLGTGISSGAVNFKDGGATTISASGNNITISSTDTYNKVKYDVPIAFLNSTETVEGNHIVVPFSTLTSDDSPYYTILKRNTCFSILKPILYLNSDCSGSEKITSDTYIETEIDTSTCFLPDFSIMLASGDNIYIRGTLIANNFITMDDDTSFISNGINSYSSNNRNNHYMLLGTAAYLPNGSVASSRVRMLQQHPIFEVLPDNSKILCSPYADNAGTVNGHTINADVPSNAVFTDTKNTAGSTDISSKIYLIGATSQGANPQTYSDNEVYTTSGVLTATKVKTAGIYTNKDASNTSGGISLYASDDPANYGITMRGTDTTSGQLGKFGYVQGGWAGYLCFYGDASRGFIYRHSGVNKASINGDGNFVTAGSVTVGGNTTNTSGATMQYNSTTKSIDFIFS